MKRKTLLLLWLIAMMLAPRWGFAQDNIKHQPRQANEQMLVVGEPSGTPRATASVPFYETFEGTIDWTIVNGSATNKWYVGSPGAHYGGYGLFISNDSGSTNAYTVGNASVVYAYKDIYLEVGTYNLSFDIRQYGESTWDCVGAMLYNSSTTPSASTSSAGSGLTSFPSGYTTMITGVGYSFSNGSWKNSSTNFTVSEAGTYKLTFCWKNDTSSGTQPPASIDNVSVEKCYNALYTVSASADPSNGGALVHSETYNFDDHSMQGWTSLDADGDGFGWDFGAAPLLYEPTYTFEGYNSSADCMISGSYDNHGYELTPDNYLVSPQVQLGGSISFYARNRSNTYPEHLGVAVSTSGNTSASSFTTIQHWDVTSESWTLYTVDLSTYAGQTGYVAIRNYNYSDHFQVFVDDITITSGSVSNYSQSLANGVSSTVTAAPSSGYSFFGWTENDNLISANTSYTFTATGNRALTANFGEAYLISDSGDITTCSGAICDPGGPTGNYGNSNSYTRTIYPGTEGRMIQLVFTQFATEGVSWDYLDIFDGTSSSAPSLGRWGGSNSPGTVRATNPDGALTLYWHSDGSSVDAGFTALISCVEPTPVLNVTSVGITTASLEWTGASSGYTLQYGTPSLSADFETGDMSQASFTYSGGNWTTSTTSPYNGTYCAKSGNAGTASSTSYMEVSVTLSNPGLVSFAGKVSSETCCDHGYFYIDGTEQVRVADDAAWHTYSYPLTAGTHTLRWAYTKDNSVNNGDDCFYVDDIKIYNIASSVSTSNTNYNLSGLTAETDYVALVKGTDSPWSDPVFFTTESASDAYPISGSGDVTTCSGIFTDSNPSGNYSNSESYTRTFYPGTQDHAVQMTFLSFDTEGADYLYVYDGTSTSATQIGVYSGHSVTCPFTVKATNSAGALTFRFTSDGSIVYPGWEAEIACVEPKPVLTVSDITTNSAAASWTGASSSYTLRYGAVNPYVDFETGDMSQASFTYSGGNWTTSTTSPYNGTYCAKSGNAGTASSTSYMEVSVTLSNPGVVSFAAKISSESGWDKGYFYINDVVQSDLNGISGAGSWQTYSYNLAAGTYTFKWAYSKDGSTNSNDDCFYVDDIMVADLVNTATTSSTSYDMTGLTMGTWYMATVQGANSDMSDPVVFQTPSTHTLTASVSPSGSGSVSCNPSSSNGVYNHGTSVTITPSAATGYTFSNWTVDGATQSGNTCTVTMDQDHNVVANFTLNTYTVQVSASPSNGGTVSGGGTFNHGTSPTVTATEATGYHFVNWTEGGNPVSTNASYTITNISASHTLVANFEQNSYLIQATPNPSEGGTASGTGTYNHGATVTLTATANTGYTFTNWTKNGTQVSTNTTYTFNATETATYVANFNHDTYTLTYQYTGTVPSGAPAVPAQTTHYYNDQITAATVPTLTGYTFSGWSGEVSTMPAHDVTVTGYWTVNRYTITVNSNWPAAGSATGGGEYDYGTNIQISATANPGYSFSRWSDGNTDNPRTVTVTGDHTYVAEFTHNQYTITLNPGQGGNASGGGTYYYGDECTVTALPNTGYSFVSWTENGNEVSTSASYTFIVTGPRTLAANFELTPPSFTTTVNSVTDNSANMSGAVTYGGSITEYGFCWNTTGETPTTLVAGSYYRVGNGTPSGSFTQNITGLTSNTLYYVWSYVVSNSTVMCGDRQTFTTLAQVTTASATNVTTYDATMGGSWATGGGATITGCGVVYGTGSTPTIGDGTSTQVAMASPSSPFTLQNSSNLLAETTYYVRAYVTNAGGTSYGAAVPFTTLGYYGIAYMVSPAASDGVITFNPAGDGQGQGTKDIPYGNDNSNNGAQFFPFASNVSKSFDEMLYPALTVDGNTVQGDIQSISFFVKTKATGAQNPNLNIYLMETSSTTLTSGVPVPVANLCYSGIVSTPSSGWVDITLDTPYAYQGGNLLVAVKYSGSGAYTWKSTDEDNRSLCFLDSELSDGYISGTGTGWTEQGLSHNQLPNAKFTIATASGNTEWCSYGYTTTASASTNNLDYVFDHWTVDGTDVTGNNPTYTFNNITANHTITANFVLTYKRFFTDGNWNVAGNWDPEGVPTLSDEIAIEANAIIPSGVIGYANKIRPITHANSSITIKDGGQLVHNNGSNNMVTVTVENDIDGYTAAEANTNKGYEIVSFPVDNLTAGNSAITGVFTGSQHPFDFYRFDASVDPLEWVHMASNSAISLLDGFIYASQDGTTIRVTGPVMSSASNYSSSDVTFLDNDAPRFNGWALMGNPFVCNAYVSLGTNNGAGAEANFYKLYNNTDYDEFIPFSSGDAVTPMGGMMFRVYDDDNIVYSRTAPSGAKTGILNVDVRKTTSRGTTTIDRARVRFGEGRNLEKFQFDTRHTKIYIPEGDQDFSVYYADGAGTIPVNFKAQDNGRYTLDFSTEEVSFNYLHLIDNMNGNDVDLLQTPYYAFDAKSTDFASRFTLVFATGNDNDDTFAFFNNGVWIINNDGDATLQVVDALGRMLSSENISGSTSKAINVAPGVYMLRLINGDKVKVQKIVVKR